MRIIFIFCVIILYGCQVQKNLDNDQYKILNLEVSRLKNDFVNELTGKNVTGDSIVINSEIQNYWPVEMGYGLHAIRNGDLSEAEANEIFGKGANTFFEMPKVSGKWNYKSFKNLKVFLFDDKQHVAAIGKPADSEKKYWKK